MNRLLTICCVLMTLSTWACLAIIYRQMEQDRCVYESAINEAVKRHEAQVLRLHGSLQEAQTSAMYYKKLIEPYHKKNWKEKKK
jgi:hypothetical protein